MAALLAPPGVQGAAVRTDDIHGSGKELGKHRGTTQDGGGYEDLSPRGVHPDSVTENPS